MNKRIPLGTVIALILLAIALTVTATVPVAMRYFNNTISNAAQLQNTFDHLAEVDKAARQNFYIDINGEQLRESLAHGYVEGMGDPYAEFFTADEYRKESERLSGKWTGLGLEVSLRTGGELVITSVQRGSPAASAGMQKGDIVTMFDNNAVTANQFENIRTALLNNKSVKLSIDRNGTSHAFEISASSYTVTSVESRLIGTTGVIRIAAFFNNTPEQFKNAMTDLNTRGAQQYIFDLRNNAGGTIEAATSIIGALVPKGTFANSVDRDGNIQPLLSDGSMVLSKPAVTLVNGVTAGEAELFAAVLKRYQNVNIIGTNTRGRAMILKMFPITSDGSAIKMSAAKYQLTDQSDFGNKGVTIDLQSALTPVQESQFAFLTDKTDPQLLDALAAFNAGTQTETTANTATEPS